MAKNLGLARTTVRDAVDELARMGLVEVGENGGVRLTEFGKRLAEQIQPPTENMEESGWERAESQ